jgi:hypothetical protein
VQTVRHAAEGRRCRRGPRGGEPFGHEPEQGRFLADHSPRFLDVDVYTADLAGTGDARTSTCQVRSVHEIEPLK